MLDAVAAEAETIANKTQQLLPLRVLFGEECF